MQSWCKIGRGPCRNRASCGRGTTLPTNTGSAHTTYSYDRRFQKMKSHPFGIFHFPAGVVNYIFAKTRIIKIRSSHRSGNYRELSVLFGIFTYIFRISMLCFYGFQKNIWKARKFTWISGIHIHVTNAWHGSTNEDASFSITRMKNLTGVIPLLQRGLVVRAATTLVYQTSRRWFDSRHHWIFLNFMWF